MAALSACSPRSVRRYCLRRSVTSRLGRVAEGGKDRSNGPDVHVLLARGDDPNLKHEIVKGQLDSVELGPLKGNQGDQNYDLPASVDLQKYNAAVIYCERFHAVFGLARLEQF